MKTTGNVLAFVLVASLGLGIFFLPLRVMAQQPTDPAATSSQQVPVTAVPGRQEATSPTTATTPAVPVKEVPSPAAPSHATEQAEWALIGSFALQYLKKTKWFSFLTTETSGSAQAVWGFLLALFTAAGIHFSVSGNWMDGAGAAITITGVSLTAFKDVAWQWAVQQGIYKGLVKDNATIAAITGTSVTH